MVTITISNNFTHFLSNGHCNYGNYGNDIVCAGVSSIIIGGINEFFKINDLKFNLIHNESGNIEFDIYDMLKEATVIQTVKIQQNFATMITQLETIEEAYKDFVKINID